MRILKINAGVRYYEDGKVNGVYDISFEEQLAGLMPKIPCAKFLTIKQHNIFTGKEYDAKELRWCLEINAETGVILNWHKGIKASVHYKVCDDCMIEYFVDDDLICNNDGYWYCPDFLAIDDEGYGDYIIMNIDEDGKIEHWNPEDVDKWIKNQLKKLV